jgi:hypothetical protein
MTNATADKYGSMWKCKNEGMEAEVCKHTTAIKKLYRGQHPLGMPHKILLHSQAKSIPPLLLLEQARRRSGKYEVLFMRWGPRDDRSRPPCPQDRVQGRHVARSRHTSPTACDPAPRLAVLPKEPNW